MTIRVVDNRKLDMTEDEFSLYQKIVQSYTTLSNNGADLFIDLFESNDNGIITFLKPPSKRHTTLEIFLFLISLMNSQHLRLMYRQVADLAAQVKGKMSELDEKISLLK